MHLKIVLYFWHKVVSGLVASLALAIAGTLYFEDIYQPIPLFIAASAVAFAWFGWRMRVQRKFDFSMTKTAFKTYLPLCAITVAAMTLGSKELVSSMMVSPPRIIYLIYLAGLIVSIAVGAQIFDYERMAKREKISYRRRKVKSESRSNWRRSSGSKVFKA